MGRFQSQGTAGSALGAGVAGDGRDTLRQTDDRHPDSFPGGLVELVELLPIRCSWRGFSYQIFLVFGAAGRVTPNLVATVGIEAWRFFCRQSQEPIFR